MNTSDWNHPSKPRYQLTAPANETNGSWWTERPRDGFSLYCESELKRMRASRFGSPFAILVEGVNQPSAQEQMRERKRKDGLGAYAQWQKQAGF